MSDENERIKIAQWLLEQTLGWIATADVKVGVAIALDTAMLGGLAAAFASSDYHLRTAWCYFFVAASTAGMAFALFCAGMAALPRMRGPLKSMNFFWQSRRERRGHICRGVLDDERKRTSH